MHVIVNVIPHTPPNIHNSLIDLDPFLHPSSLHPPKYSIIDSIVMAKSKSAKRKRAAQAQLPSKALKTTNQVTPPPDGPTFEPKSLQTVVSEEELEIAIETLTTLAQYPGLTKSKACKDLRVAVYDFRQACTTGVNSAGMSPILRSNRYGRV